MGGSVTYEVMKSPDRPGLVRLAICYEEDETRVYVDMGPDHAREMAFKLSWTAIAIEEGT